MVTGSVAALELVEKATNWAGKIPLKKKLGLLFNINLTAIVYITISENKPIISVIEYNNKLFNRSHLGASTISVANNAKTPKGAKLIIRSIIFNITSLSESKKSFNGLDFFSGIRIMDIPNKIEKKIIWSIFLLSVAAFIIFDGTISIIGWRGPEFLVSAAASLFLSASSSYAFNNSILVSSEIEFPGLIIFTIPRPTLTAITVVIK